MFFSLTIASRQHKDIQISLCIEAVVAKAAVSGSRFHLTFKVSAGVGCSAEPLYVAAPTTGVEESYFIAGVNHPKLAIPV